jgi:glycosyltransferase involved in cell wall biosynthesis
MIVTLSTPSRETNDTAPVAASVTDATLPRPAQLSAPMSVPMPLPLPLYCNWPMGTRSSAELMALHLTLQLQESTSARMIPVMAPLLGIDLLAPAAQQAVALVFETARSEIPRIARASDGATIPAVALHLLGDALEGMPQPLPLPARHNVGVVQTCDTRFDAGARAHGEPMDLLLAGSTWMRDVLQRSGLRNVTVYPTGIDTSLFAPGPKSGHLGERFVIFSGGRLDYHKGQDIVLAAVKIFRQRQPETLLLTTWQSPLPETAGSLTRSGHAPVAPEFYGTTLNVSGWATANGLPSDAIVDLGHLSQAALAVVLREADVALFPNRAESDVNPMVLECMASGVPVIVSQNTGHLDLARTELCYPLVRQGELRGPVASSGTDGWGESSVEEVVAQLEVVYAQSGAARKRAAVAAEWARAFGWDVHAARLLDLMAPIIPKLMPPA